MDHYPPIAEHGLIGDLQTAALVTSDGCVDWFCCPQFDSPSVFASLLDHDQGGRFRIGPVGEDTAGIKRSASSFMTPVVGEYLLLAAVTSLRCCGTRRED